MNDANRSSAMIDPNGQPCRFCHCSRRTYTFRRFKGQRVAVIGCAHCSRTTAVDVTFDVPMVLVTVEQRRTWWANFYA